RKDLFDKAGLEEPSSYDAILAAAEQLNSSDVAGFVGSNIAGDAFTEQTFEHIGLGNNCQLVDDSGTVTFDSAECVEALDFYGQLEGFSPSGEQDVDTTRAQYFAGKAAMTIWSTFILDELAGLRNDALPTCSECRGDKTFLAKNSGVVTAIKGPSGSEPTQFGEVTNFSIIKDGNTEPAKQFVEYMMSDGYTRWLSFAPEGKFPVRAGSKDNPTEYIDAWNKLEAGVDTKAPLSDFYPPEVLTALTKSTDTMSRWGFQQGQGRLVGAQLAELPIPKALASEISGKLTADAAAKQAQADVEEIAQSIE
ncbi:MAG: ABC transporter substrate-binding protein, partial [Actinomycetota bacterium]